jgi:hypothetical protein
MVFPVVGGDGKPTGYEISNAATFYSNTSLTRTMGTPTSTRKFTYAGWLKRSNLDIQSSFLSWGGSTYATDLRYESGSDSLYFFFDDNSGWYAKTKSKYRDVSAWYHVVLAVDTTQATESNRVKLYVNGTQYGPALDGTDWTQHEIFGQNYDFPELANGQTMAIGKRNSSGSHFFDGYMSEIYFIDGQALDSSYFGETNDNGVWIPKEYTGTYGNNGFRLEFKQTGTSQNSSGIGADTSGNDNHFASNNLASWVIGTDTPTNNFCTLNPLAVNASNVLSSARGNTQVFDTNNDNFRIMGTTMPFTKGKWYVECKFSGGTNDTIFGFLDVDNRFASQYNYTASGSWPGYISDGNSFGYRENGYLYTNGNETTGKTTWSANRDFLGLAIDADNNATYAHVNGTYVDSGDPTSGSSKTGSLSNFTQTGAIMIAISVKAASYNGAYVNFGNPVNNDSGVTNSNADANGHGKFQYSVPSGYFAICTKNLAEYG